MSIDDEETKLSFIAEWFDPHPQILHKFLLKYYPKSQEVEMKDLKGTRKFLKKTKINIPRDEFVINAVVVIFSRDLKLVSYGDDETRKILEPGSEKALAVLTQPSPHVVGNILTKCESIGLTLVDLKTLETRESNEGKVENAAFPFRTTIDVSFECCGHDATSTLTDIIESANSISEKAGDERMDERHIAIASNSDEAKAFKERFFYKKKNLTAKYDVEQSTCCVIKPHAVKSRLVGKIIEDIIGRGLNVTAMEVIQMDRTRATEFCEVYRKIKDYHDMVDELCSGPMLALEIASSVQEFRVHCGPYDVEMAKSLHPETIRARFGKNKIQNAVHCTDLDEDNINELSYLFDILASGE